MASNTIFLLMFMIVTTYASIPKSFNKTCIGDEIGSLNVGEYQSSCPEVEAIIFSWVEKAVSDDPRMAASLLRLHFHDCFVNGCDASVLLDDTDTFMGEKSAGPNLNSLRGFEVIDAIKFDIESICPDTVSCADILAIVARDSVLLSGGPRWEVEMGRRDSFSANKSAANSNIPGPNSNVETLITMFQNLGLSLNDMVALSGAHTIGKARCSTFSTRLTENTNSDDPHINTDFLASLQQLCSHSENSNAVTMLDLVTPATFDNQYYVNLLSGEGLLPSDDAIVAGNSETRSIVELYAQDQVAFFEDFKISMLKMGSLMPVTGNSGGIRQNCRFSN